jgi:hypothetical protein
MQMRAKTRIVNSMRKSLRVQRKDCNWRRREEINAKGPWGKNPTGKIERRCAQGLSRDCDAYDDVVTTSNQMDEKQVLCTIRLASLALDCNVADQPLAGLQQAGGGKADTEPARLPGNRRGIRMA